MDLLLVFRFGGEGVRSGRNQRGLLDFRTGTMALIEWRELVLKED